MLLLTEKAKSADLEKDKKQEDSLVTQLNHKIAFMTESCQTPKAEKDTLNQQLGHAHGT